MEYPATLEIVPFVKAPRASVRVPGSKSITNRALVLAALAARFADTCTLSGVLQSEDTDVMVESLRRLGFTLDVDWRGEQIRVASSRRDRWIPANAADLYVANSGTTMRFLTAMLALGQGRYRLDGVPRMRERPIQDLLAALEQLGATATSEAGNGCPPVVLQTNGLRGGEVSIRGDISSQFLSGLLMAAPFADRDVTIQVVGPLVSVPYVTMTLAMMRAFGLQADADEVTRFVVPGRQHSRLAAYAVEPDASAASYFFALAAITRGRITVAGLNSQSLQGDVQFADALVRMGCAKSESAEGICVTGGELQGIDIDMNAISDTVMTLAAVACFANGPTTIRNVAHIRHKETDRISALANELRRLGARVHESADGLTIEPRPLRGATVETYNDHRMAMSLALVGVRVPQVILRNPGCVAKTYPRFFQDLDRLR